MANYSSQKLKSVSLNNEPRRYANQKNGTSPKPISSSDSAKMNKPLITPLSEGGKPTEPQIEQPPTSTAVVRFDWLGMFHRTFLSIYMEEQDPLVGPGKFDFAFKVGHQRLYVLIHEEVAEVDSPNVSKARLSGLRQQAATYINKRFQQLTNKDRLLKLSEEQDINAVHYIGLTSLTLVHEGESFQIEHEFGSSFFQEECVLDLDDESKILQLFSLNSFYQMVKLLLTPSDLLSYFDYHLSKLVDFDEFKGEFELAQQFLNSPVFYQRALDVQQQLVEIGLLSKVETRLLKMTNPNDKLSDSPQPSEQQTELTQKLQSHATMFQKLLNGATKRRHEAEETIPLDQVKILVAESMYTRMSIMEEMLAYENRSREECLNGYLSHQHSYNDFGHHYVIVVYGLNPEAEYSRDYIQQNYSNLLMDINAQLQNPAMQQYFLLGFDMSNDDGKGNVTVVMDIYHQAGSELSAIEQRHH